MKHVPYILATKLVPPRLKAQCLRRKRLDERFLQVLDYPVTVLQADAGYGKSTALATHLCSQFDHVAWYSIEKAERDAVVFMHYLIHAMKTLDPQIGERSLRLLEEAESSALVVQPCLTLLINDLAERAPDPTLLVLDDFHTVSGVQEIHAVMDLLVRYLPAHVHLVIGSRKSLDFSAVKRLHSTWDLLMIDKAELAFRPEEVRQLFEGQYGIELSGSQVQELQEQTEGWIIALQMVWKGMERGIDLAQFWRAHAEHGPEAGTRLFHYLAEEVFDRQPGPVQHFLTETCVLETMEPVLCDQLLGTDDSAELLSQLERNGLFVTSVGQAQYRYHRLFQQFLITHCKTAFDEAWWTELHRRAADVWLKRGDVQQALAHLYAVHDLDECVQLLLQCGDKLLANGRLELMKHWIGQLPSGVLEQHPELLYWRGEIDRGLSCFHEAVHWYTLAEGAYIQKGDALGRSRVYRGQAQVYLDTIQPNKATHWLKMAVQVLSDEHGVEKAQVLRLLAENYTNNGQLQRAQELVRQADQLVPVTERDVLDVRICLRSGRLEEAKRMSLSIIEKEQDGGREQQRVPKAHREMHLLLALIDAFFGETESSRWHAEQGIHMGQKLQSPFVEAVGYMRLGHAYVLAHDLQRAQEYYKLSVKMSESLCVERGKVEALMGLCNTSGLLGDLEQAETYARAGVELALEVQDHWCANLVRLAMGGVFTQWGHEEAALPWLRDSEAGFAACGDRFLLAATRMWLGVLYHRTGQKDEWSRCMTEMLAVVEADGYHHLFMKRTLFGPLDLQLVVPALIAARDELGLEAAERVLRKMGCKGVQQHPGYTLRICTLGSFALYRGMEEVSRKEWKREKSRQLFQLLVAKHGQLLQRDEIYDLLWPEVDEKTANRDFKVAMNALTNVLEPKREARSESFFIERLDTSYRLHKGVTIWVDVQEFARRAERGLSLADRSGQQAAAVMELEAAVALYKGDFLQHYPYLEWCADERDRVRTLYLRVLEALGALYMDRGSLQEAVLCAERILGADSCWEGAYRMLMSCYHQLGNRQLVIAMYKKCVAELDLHLGLVPMEETTRLYQRLVRRS